MEVLLLDNHDSFTHNIAHIVRENTGVNLQIITSDRIDIDNLAIYDGIIFSPGPDIPEKGNIMERVLERYKGKVPILGICLGLQAITLYFGGKIVKLDEVVHGRTRRIIRTKNHSLLYNGIAGEFSAGLYHSWIADKETLPGSLKITAVSPEGRIMSLNHSDYSIEALQFHPESIMTPFGPPMITNWIKSLL